jgi:hypothetical protein
MPAQGNALRVQNTENKRALKGPDNLFDTVDLALAPRVIDARIVAPFQGLAEGFRCVPRVLPCPQGAALSPGRCPRCYP